MRMSKWSGMATHVLSGSIAKDHCCVRSRVICAASRAKMAHLIAIHLAKCLQPFQKEFQLMHLIRDIPNEGK